jgi:HD-GYP domain-containing protein (c-di-GMP phosphodiesterase class II)
MSDLLRDPPRPDAGADDGVAELLLEGVGEGLRDSIKDIETDPGDAAKKVGVGAFFGSTLALLNRQSGAVGLGARILGASFGLSFAADVLTQADKVADAVKSTADHSGSFEENKEVIAGTVGPMVVDGALMSLGGAVGASVTRVPQVEGAIMQTYTAAAKHVPFGPVAREQKVMSELASHSPIMFEHSRRMSEWSGLVGPHVGVPKWEGQHAGLLHDAGKIRTPLSILHGDGPLTDWRLEKMRHHVVDSAKYLAKYVRLPAPFRRANEGVAQHHEALDGSGYPLKLQADDINPVGRMLRTLDVFDSITSTERTYTARKPLEKVHDIMMSERGTKMDASVVDALYAQRASDALRIMESAPGRPPLGDVAALEGISLGRVLEVASKKSPAVNADEQRLVEQFERIYTAPGIATS